MHKAAPPHASAGPLTSQTNQGAYTTHTHNPTQTQRWERPTGPDPHAMRARRRGWAQPAPAKKCTYRYTSTLI
eukprot:357060-Chlamydomonas_euryale.AAC.4